ncbi:hypothetical protein GUJ93_ZPchr0012g21002 [Zizania palustris]|uniref:Dof zinc finger protein n=1 Tax=Zizania palustris TaxID=103762 RepID=A0A8J6BTM1_ZIZPA|nr:hypothetical protein GUJ93_ZPchr0012g21002 [Zizania palustris]
MVFSSLPFFLDPPNWNQLQQQPLQCLISGGGGGGSDHHHLMPPPSGLAPLPGGTADTAASAPAVGSSVSMQAAAGAAQHPRPAVVSMSERARLARVPLPDPGTLRCPRCDSSNTKFCYFNNYSLSQPRHFCKACRRYWTRGGALRNVPVGGGCRRNTKRSSKKSSRQGVGGGSAGGGGAMAATSSSSTTSTSTTATTSSAVAAAAAAADVIASMQGLSHHFGSLPSAAALEASLEGYHHHHHLSLLQPASFLQQGLHGYHFADGDGGVLADGFPRGVASGLLAQLASIKMEEHGAGNNGSGAGVGFVGAHDHYWPGSGGAGGWPAEFLSGFSSSSSGNVL